MLSDHLELLTITEETWGVEGGIGVHCSAGGVEDGLG